MANARTDIHSPKHLITEDYEYLTSVDLNPRPEDGGEYHSPEDNRAISAACDWVDAHGFNTGTCVHCGAHIRYAAILQYKPEGYNIMVGETCLDNRFGRATADFQALRKRAELDRQAQRIKGLVAKFVEANPDLAWMSNVDATPATSARNNFVQDVARKLRQYGELSERQIAAVRASVAKDAEWAAERAAKADAKAEAEAANPAQDCPTGRVEIVGLIKTTKAQESQFGTAIKMLVEDDRGFRVWGTVPSSLFGRNGDSPKGLRVKFLAAVEPSRDNAKFGFFSRPAKAERLSHVDTSGGQLA